LQLYKKVKILKLFSVFPHCHSGPVVGQQTHGVWARGPRHGSRAQHLQREDASQDRQAPRRHLNIIDYRQRSNKTLTDLKLPMNKKILTILTDLIINHRKAVILRKVSIITPQMFNFFAFMILNKNIEIEDLLTVVNGYSLLLLKNTFL
jgi:hypothetical protein